ncbi:ChaN family lipoprotein [Marinobacter zhanjiangensis]|uniref:Haem-binding uptake Tiki superfamily ChaN domain-containing protein n=1 Tax=Marinobacter zhanjiangensis TaxID=578215 RepID=A0ABQ3B9A4_9GAMM|nr:ChaN family lipoprotein [Marinobacter zhanjiangensis]GGY84336.1 hypothetical protein GCM10007071_34580 [Marinobacter zhanjiangensis]
MPSPHAYFYLPGLLAAALLSGCAGLQTEAREAPATLYESVAFNAESGQPVTIPAMAQQLTGADVIVVGEYHGHQAAHLLQSNLQAALHHQHPKQVLALEPFDLDHQNVIDAYLAEELGEEELIEDAGAWNNYKASYRPLMEFARRQQLPVIAANAPADTVRCVGRQGPDYLASLPPARRTLLPEEPWPDIPGYRSKFLNTMGGNSHGQAPDASRERLDNAYRAQLLRDSTMADRIIQARQRYPDHQVLMITGTFHSEQRLGLVGVLEQRRPDLRVAVISPVVLEDDGADLKPGEHAAKGNYLYFVLPLPEQYQDEDRRNAAMKKQFSQARGPDCQ